VLVGCSIDAGSCNYLIFITAVVMVEIVGMLNCLKWMADSFAHAIFVILLACLMIMLLRHGLQWDDDIQLIGASQHV
jgi:hypothetical protein